MSPSTARVFSRPVSPLCRLHSPFALLIALAATAAMSAPAFADATVAKAAVSTAQDATSNDAIPLAASEVTMERIMADPDWIGGAPNRAYWSADGATIYFQRDPEGEDDDPETWRIDVDTRASEKVPVHELSTVDDANRDWSEDRRRVVYVENGDVFVRDVESDLLQQLTRTAARESDAFFLVRDRRVAFRRGDDWFVRDLDTGLESQPVEIVVGEDPLEDEPADDFLSAQQRRLFEVVREDDANAQRRKERERARRTDDPGTVPPPFFLDQGIEILGTSLSPRADAAVVISAPEKRDEGKRAQMPNYVGDDGYTQVRDVRAKVGIGGDYTHSLHLLDLSVREVHAIDLSALPGITEDPLAFLEESKKDGENDEADEGSEASGDDEEEAEPAKPRNVRVYGISWSPDGAHALVYLQSYDNKDRWYVLLSRDETAPRLVHHLHMESWINWDHNEHGWLPDGRIWLLSEESGTSHLLVHDPAAGTTEALTEGDFVVANPQHDPDGTFFYVVANVERPTKYDVYRVASSAEDGGELERITDLGGLVDFDLDPAGERIVVRHSSLLRPPELYVQRAEPGAKATRLTSSTSDDFDALTWVEPQVLEVPSTHHDRPVWARFYPPKNPDRLRGADGKVPAVLFVHGAGYLQNAHEGWSNYFREFMFHTLLSEQGYAVLDMDYRGSKGYGADWRSAIYRHMGQPELEDLLDGRDWLIAEHGVDPRRVGIYGGSYGGFMVMMALFKEPGTFAAGAALRPVTDWAHYNHPYTSNILNTPDVDPEAYARSSPIEFAAGLEDPLLICAPMLDDNVHFQDVVRLSQKLIELDKTGWEVALFPVEPHGFRRASSWLHEYRRIFGLFEEHLQP